MQISSILWLTRTFLALSLLLVVYLIGFYSPYIDNNSGTKSYSGIFALLFGIFVFFASSTTLVFFRIRRKYFEEGLWSANYGIAFRQGILLSLAAVSLLILQVFRVLTWWDGLLVLGAIFMAELYFLVR